MLLKILQINTDRVRAAHDLMTARVKQLNIDMCLISEPNKTKTKDWEGHPDAKVYISKNSTYISGSGAGSGFSWVEFEKIIIVSCYVSPNSDMEYIENTLGELSQLIQNKRPKGFLIGGDFNAKSPEWGSNRTDPRGSILSEWINSENLYILNIGNSPTFRRHNQESVIDITLATEDLAGKVKGWKVLEEETLSLHQYIYFEIDLSPSNPADYSRTTDRKWNIKSLNVQVLLNTIEEGIKNRNINTVDIFVDIVNKACDKAMKKIRPNQKKEVYWWNSDINDKRKECIKKRRAHLRSGRRANVDERQRKQKYEQYLEAKRDLAFKIQKSKAQKWKEIVEELDKDIWGTGYKIVTKKIGRSLPNIPNEIKQDILKELFPEHPRIIFQKEEVDEGYIEEFTKEELIEAIERIKPNKAPGPDQIPPKVVKEITMVFPDLLLNVFNRLLKSGEFPSMWKEGRVVLIPKPRKPSQPPKYRPICLLNTIGKLYETLITRRLSKELDEKNVLSPYQFGFRTGKSTIDAVKRVTDICKKEMEKKRSRTRNLCLMVTLDIKNAFSSASWRHIVDSLTSNGISPYLKNIFKSYLHDRKITHGDVSFHMSAGVPQGSVAAAVLWNILYDGVLRLEFQGDVHLVAYADDLAVIVLARTENELEILTNDALAKIHNWMSEKQLEVAPEKSEAVLLSGRKKCRPLNVQINGENIKVAKELKYLGVILDYRLSFYSHIKYVTEKANKTATALAHILPRTGGAGENKRRVLQSATDSVMLYAAPVWSSSLRYITYRTRLLSQQRKSLLRVCRGYITISTEAAAVLSRVIPIDLMATERSLTFGKNTEEKEAERENTMLEWQNRWTNTEKAQWTKKLIPMIKPWYDRRHGQITYTMTQTLSGHGCFQTYLFRIGKVNSPSCVCCEEETEDSPEHTLFNCRRWDILRAEAAKQVSADLRVDNMVNIMLQNQDSWQAISDYIQKVMDEKQKLENLRRV